MSPETPVPAGEEIDRRGFLTWGAAVTSAFVSLAAFGAAILRMPMPSLLPGRSRRFKIGGKEDFPPGTARYYEDQQTYVFADQEGIYAMSATCTHLGCVVNREQEQFTCPCHGSRYDQTGKVLRGPAPKSLEWYEVRQLPSGRLLVDQAEVVESGTKFLVA